MQCPRLKHFVRFNFNGTVSRCGHMVNAPQFDTLSEMNDSPWLHNVQLYMHKGIWPVECVRCNQTEKTENTSIRLNAIEFHKTQTKSNYLIVGGVLDNICNSGCMTCDENHSTKIGSLKSKSYFNVDNSSKFWNLPLDRIVHLDINGGEPSASKNYKDILKNPPPNVQSIRINTNCSIILDEIENLIDKGIKITITVSLDGINEVHDFIRWPIQWEKFYKNLIYYKNIPKLELNTWTTVSALNIHNFLDIKKFVNEHQINHSYAFLHNPDPINVKYKNNLTLPYKNLFPDIIAIEKNNQIDLDAFITKQKLLRGIQ